MINTGDDIVLLSEVATFDRVKQDRYMITKIGKNSDILWNKKYLKRYRHNLSSITKINDNNILITGTQKGKLLMWKIDTSGKTIWENMFHDIDYYFVSPSILQTKNGDFVTSGIVYDSRTGRTYIRSEKIFSNGRGHTNIDINKSSKTFAINVDTNKILFIGKKILSYYIKYRYGIWVEVLMSIGLNIITKDIDKNSVARQTQQTQQTKHTYTKDAQKAYRNKNYKKAKLLYQKACKLDDGLACSNLGHMYTYAKGVKKNYRKAVKLYQKACDVNDRTGCNNLGDMYNSGRGVRHTSFKAAHLYKKACDMNYGLACDTLGRMHSNAQGLIRDYDKAKQLYTKSCDLNSGAGCTSLGILYRHAINNVKQDNIKAKRLFQKACKLNDAPGCYKLGDMYVHGIGIEKNFTKGIKFIEKGCKLGFLTSCMHIKPLKNKNKR